MDSLRQIINLENDSTASVVDERLLIQKQVEDLSRSTLSSVAAIRKLALKRKESSLHKRLKALRINKDAQPVGSPPTKVDETASLIAARGMLDVVDVQVQSLNLAAIYYRQGPEALGRIVGHLSTIDSRLKEVLSSLQDAVNNSKPLHPVFDIVIADDLPEWRNKFTTLGVEDDPSLPPIDSTSQVDVSENTLSPLEIALRLQSTTVINNGDTFGWFLGWAMRPHMPSSVNDAIGVVRSVHLFREKKAPLHHEFALISFGNDAVPTSWLRVERAARIKARWHMIQADSFGPLMGGAALRERASFATAKDDLVKDPADELGTVVIHYDVNSSPDSKLTVSEFAHQLRAISSTYPQYQLFSANCRWFARRTLLTVAQRLNSITPNDYTVQWREKPSSYEILHLKIQKDPFGGRQLEEAPTAIIRAQDYVRLAEIHVRAHRASEALTCCNQALEILDPNDSTEFHQYQIAAAWDVVHLAHTEQGDHEAALVALEKAIEILKGLDSSERPPGSPFRYTWNVAFLHHRLGTCLSKNGQLKRAIQAESKAVEIWYAESQKRGDDLDAHYLGEGLHDLSRYLARTGNIATAVDSEEMALIYRRQAYAANARRYGPGLFSSLRAYGDVLSKVNRMEEASTALQEGIILARQSLQWGLGGSEHVLASILNQGAKISMQLRRMDDARKLAAESVERYRNLYAEKPETFLVPLIQAINDWAGILFTASRSDEAFEAWEQAQALIRASLEAERDPKMYEHVSMVWGNKGKALLASKKVDESYYCFREASELVNPDGGGVFRMVDAGS